VSSQAEDERARLYPEQQGIKWFKQEKSSLTLIKNKGVSVQ